ncbi:MAG TPA: FixH family protein [Terriglobales bacterium]
METRLEGCARASPHSAPRDICRAHRRHHGKPVENAQVTGALTMTMMDMGKTAVKFGPKGNGDYQATVPSFDMSGPWDLTVDAAQGPLHSRRVFQVTVFD